MQGDLLLAVRCTPNQKRNVYHAQDAGGRRHVDLLSWRDLAAEVRTLVRPAKPVKLRPPLVVIPGSVEDRLEIISYNLGHKRYSGAVI